MGDALGERGFVTGGRRIRNRFGKEFWSIENLKFSEPWYRLEKSAGLIRSVTSGRECKLLDLGCGPAALMRMLPENVRYFGIDIAIPEPAPNLLEADLVDIPIGFGDQSFDVIIAQGLFEYLGSVQAQKFAEISRLLTSDGMFIVSYTNFGHRKPYVAEAFSNVQPSAQFRESLAEHFVIDRVIPEAYNWHHGQPNHRWLQALNLRVKRRIPLVDPWLAVEHFYVCSARSGA